MLVIPAIDIRGGQVVRLTQGDFKQETVYASDPLEMARKFIEEGARRIHIVDLDGARSGQPKASQAISRILKEADAHFQVGGGIRDLKLVESYLSIGAYRVICGSKACLDQGFLKELLHVFADRVLIGVDTQDGYVATDGWTKITSIRLEEMIERILGLGGREIVFTDIAKDGRLAGPNLNAIKGILEQPQIRLIASGGITRLEDIRDLIALKSDRLLGVIVGKALYEGRIPLKEALALC